MLNAEDLHNLEALVGLAAISRCNGKRRAAEEEEMSVETLNKQIRELEKNLGLKLVDTKGKNCVLTSSGKLVVNNMLEAAYYNNHHRIVCRTVHMYELSYSFQRTIPSLHRTS